MHFCCFCTKRLKADYPAPLNPYCGKNMHTAIQALKTMATFNPAQVQSRLRISFITTNHLPDRDHTLSEWANCSGVIPPDTLVLPAVQINGDDFFLKQHLPGTMQERTGNHTNRVITIKRFQTRTRVCPSDETILVHGRPGSC